MNSHDFLCMMTSRGIENWNQVCFWSEIVTILKISGWSRTPWDIRNSRQISKWSDRNEDSDYENPIAEDSGVEDDWDEYYEADVVSDV